MLALTVRTGDKGVFVDGPCYIKLVDVKGRKARLGLSAPRSTVILREEIMSEVQRAEWVERLGVKTVVATDKE